MKRTTAFDNLKLLCARFDETIEDPVRYIFIRPVRIWLIGSTLTEKQNPSDLDLVCYFDTSTTSNIEHPGIWNERMVYGKITLMEGAIRSFARGIRMVRLMANCDGDIQAWLRDQNMPPDTPNRLIWEKGLDWPSILNDIFLHPLPYNPELEEEHDQKNLVGEKRIRKVHKRILALNAKNRKNTGNPKAVYAPRTRQGGFAVLMKAGGLPSELADIRALRGKEGLFESRITVGVFSWHYTDDWRLGEDARDIVGIDGHLSKSLNLTEDQPDRIKAWLVKKVEELFAEAGTPALPIIWGDPCY